MQILEGYAEFESFAYIVRHYESAVEATSLLSSVTSLAIRVCVGISANTPQNRISPRKYFLILLYRRSRILQGIYFIMRVYNYTQNRASIRGKLRHCQTPKM